MPPLVATDPAAAFAALEPVEQLHVERLLRGLPPTFHEWCERAWPTMRWDWPHLRYLTDRLQSVIDGQCNRLLISMPPRHGKSWTATERFPVYALHDNPKRRVIVAAYNSTLATVFTRHSRGHAGHTGLKVSDESGAAGGWETELGGGMRAAGVGSGVTGFGAELIVVDDPVKNREEAESPLYRQKVWEWFSQDLWTRREPGAAVVVILTRWHEDDLIGRILADPEIGQGWTKVNLPALATEDDPLGRQPGEALCPDRFPVKELEDIRLLQGNYAFSALYQGDPRPLEGRMFPREAVEFVDVAPASAKRVRYWDKAGSKDSGDWTAGVRMSVEGRGIEQVIYIEHVERSQTEALQRRRKMKAMAEMDGTGTHVWLEQEPGSGGKDSASDDVRYLSGWVVQAAPVTGDKVVRAMPLSAQWQAGNVRLVRGEWNRAYLDEMEGFPHGKHDDQVDASSGAHAKLVGAPEFFIV